MKRAQHEAHRDGVVTSDNGLETERAVLAHTEMALKVAGDYGLRVILGNQNLTRDVGAYYGGPEAFARYTEAAYDSSADYWKLVKNEDGTGSIVWDGKRDLTNEAGDLLQKDKTGSFSRSLMKYLGREETVELLESQGYDTQGKSDAELAYALMTTSGSFWSGSNKEYKLTPTYSYEGSSLETRLSFDVTKDEAVNLGKISQRSDSIAYWVGEGDDRINVMDTTGCFYISTLGAVQTQAGMNLTAEQINSITKKALEAGYLKTDSESIFPTGDSGREGISRLAFAELGMSKGLDFNKHGKDGSLIWGNTINGNRHAREGNPKGQEIFDPYSYMRYKIGQETKKYLFYDVVDYMKVYAEMYRYGW